MAASVLLQESLPVRSIPEAAAGNVTQAASAQCGAPRLASIHVYPIKSCAGMAPPAAWPLGPTGLLYDRHWVLLAEDGAVLTQKRAPQMARLAPAIDLRARIMRLSYPGMPAPLVLPLPALPGPCPPPCLPRPCTSRAPGLRRHGQPSVGQSGLHLIGSFAHVYFW